MINWLKDNWWKVLIVLFGPMIFLNFTMDLPFVNSWSKADDSAWLGFWGGYLGAVIAIGGVYWQVHREIRNSKEIQYKDVRPIFILDIMNGSKHYEKDGPIEYNTKPLEYPAYVSEKCCKLCAYRFGWCEDSSIDLPYIQLKNISDNPMLAIQIKLIWNGNTKESFTINRLNANSNMSLLNTYTYKYYIEMQTENTPPLNIKPDNPEYIELYYLTSQNEKIFMKFKVNSGYKVPNLVEKRLEGKGDHFNLSEYQIDNSVESKKLPAK